MSTRFYPRFVKGNPQLRIYLPDFWMTLVKNPTPGPSNKVTFKVPVQMTELDVRNYLEKIYQVPVVEVKSKITCGKLDKAPGQNYLIKGPDYRLAHVKLPSGCTFNFPQLFPLEKAVETEDADEMKKTLDKGRKTQVRQHWDRQDIPHWFSF